MHTVWCLLIDQDRKPNGASFTVEVRKTIADLMREVRNEQLIVLQNVPAFQLKVWRCKDRKTVFNRTKSEEQVRNAFNDGAELLEEKEKLENLDLEEEETLLEQMPVVWKPEPGSSKRRLDEEDIASKRRRFSEAQERDVEAARQALPASSAAAIVGNTTRRASLSTARDGV
ncbi:hypothetical protein DXG01_010518 [Tephrocybe rancida]|nr:hypothetical protein DXG01_010518 [Tephrocybe rancida]